MNGRQLLDRWVDRGWIQREQADRIRTEEGWEPRPATSAAAAPAHVAGRGSLIFYPPQVALVGFGKVVDRPGLSTACSPYDPLSPPPWPPTTARATGTVAAYISMLWIDCCKARRNCEP